MLGTIFLVFSFVLALVAAASVPPLGERWQWGWLAFAFYVASLLFGDVSRLIH